MPTTSAFTWEQILNKFDKLVSGKQDRHKFATCLKDAIEETNVGSHGECDSWVSDLLIVLSRDLHILLSKSSLNNKQKRFLGFIVGVIAQCDAEGREFLIETCSLSGEHIDQIIKKVESGDGHDIAGWWRRLKLAEDNVRSYLKLKIENTRRSIEQDRKEK